MSFTSPPDDLPASRDGAGQPIPPDGLPVARPRGILCVRCLSPDTRVLWTRDRRPHERVRRHVCVACMHRFHTVERATDGPLLRGQ